MKRDGRRKATGKLMVAMEPAAKALCGGWGYVCEEGRFAGVGGVVRRGSRGGMGTCKEGRSRGDEDVVRKGSRVAPGLAVCRGHSQSSGRAAAPDLRSCCPFHVLLLE